ncbi:histone H4 transcription factor-like isoform X2 [Sipha flava]|uniref:Histone H4 transcription factor-like isoform X2 n=1 Tax=Sipha flava TaxID=143950 RepID=A0A8B8GSR5_9HEMI|nr:histone H4 transcription factor-like isoform X2 [Sipha flava]
MNPERNSDTGFLCKRERRTEESNDDSMFAAQTYLSVDQKTDCGSMSMMKDKQYWCQQWVFAHREGNVAEEKKYVAKKCVVTNSFDDTASYESSLDLNNLKKRMKQPSRIKKLDLDKVEMNFSCAWEECDYESSHINDYFYHVSGHVDYLWTEEWQSNKDKWFTCLWNSCTFQSHCEVKSTTHVNFHAYHTRLKCIGLAVLTLCEIPGCKLNGEGTNILPDLPNEFECNWENCNERFECMQYYSYHVAEHFQISEFEKYNFNCPWRDCTLQFTARYRLVDHIKSHTQEKSCACPNCGIMFATHTKLKDHCRQSNKDKSNQCSLCKKTFSCERLLKQHVRLHINYYKCHLCDASFSRASQLSTHIRYRHIGIKPFKCKLCDSKFVRKLDFNNHLKKHTAGPLFKCSKDDCDFSCRSEYAMRKHINMEHYDNTEELYKYYCHLCDDLFLRGSFLTKHLEMEHNFHKPSGLKRFRYIEDDDGYYKLQMSRYECLDIQEQKKIKLVKTKQVIVKKNIQTISNGKQTLNFNVEILKGASDEDDDEDD